MKGRGEGEGEGEGDWVGEGKGEGGWLNIARVKKCWECKYFSMPWSDMCNK